MIIGITGKNGAGKTTVAEYLKSKGFEYLSLSDILREEARKKGIGEDRESLIEFGNNMRKNFGLGILAILALKKIKPEKNYCVDSIRNVEEINELKKNKNFLLIGVDADPKTRYKRMLERGRLGENISFEKFIEWEKREDSTDKEKQQLGKCLELADKIIKNDGNVEELYQKVDEILDVKSK